MSRSSLYHRPKGERAENLALMRRMDELHMAYPFYGSRQLMRHLRREGVTAGRHRIRRLMRLMGMEAIYRRPRTSVASPQHRVFPYLLRGLTIARADHVWCADITYVPVTQRVFLPRGRDGLGDPARARLAAVEHDGRLVLRRSAGRRAGLAGTGDPEHRSRRPVHQRGLCGPGADVRAWRSRWTAGAASSTTSSSSGCGGR